MATKRKVGGYAWNDYFERAYHALTRIRQKCEALLALIQQRPFQIRVAAIHIAAIATAAGECADVLRDLESIAEDASEGGK